MPLVVICGRPCVGKTSFAKFLCDFLTAAGHEAVIINDESLGISKSIGYHNATAEKISRAKLKSAVERSLSTTRVVIADGLNYIKGFRYELFVAVRTARTTHCVAWIDATPADAEAVNAARGGGESAAVAAGSGAPAIAGYPAAVLSDLWSRFEAPDERVRWDEPLVRVPGVEGFAAAAPPLPPKLPSPSEPPPAAALRPAAAGGAFKRTGVRIVLGKPLGAAAPAPAPAAVPEPPPPPSPPLPADDDGYDSGGGAGDRDGSFDGDGGGDCVGDLLLYAAAGRVRLDEPAARGGGGDSASVASAAIGSSRRPRKLPSRDQGGQQQHGDSGNSSAIWDEAVYAAALARLDPAASARYGASALAVARALFLRRAYTPSLAVLPAPSAPPLLLAALHTAVTEAAADVEAQLGRLGDEGGEGVACAPDGGPRVVPVRGSPTPLRLTRALPLPELRRLRAEFLRAATAALAASAAASGDTGAAGGLEAVPRRFVEFIQAALLSPPP